MFHFQLVIVLFVEWTTSNCSVSLLIENENEPEKWKKWPPKLWPLKWQNDPHKFGEKVIVTLTALHIYLHCGKHCLLYISSLVLLPSPVALSVLLLSFSALALKTETVNGTCISELYLPYCTRATPKGLTFRLCLYVSRLCNVHVLFCIQLVQDLHLWKALRWPCAVDWAISISLQ